ncbi:RNA guanine-N7 methyltransferase-activating subunit-like protein [Latimeria chalumnae]|uniref:RNA guanine-7 methyltransferase activating subunit n=1 Tax=Latimeria chalumnae TaxID=7897 RepID=H3BEF5_LATCH|nr:PREDICTED: RNMT-activating mini protein [Latimeria chalumnae]|eukprot:XP_005989680.1 PREDICTED: RNMT-activating mini protein [Latimeria chalumnae]
MSTTTEAANYEEMFTHRFTADDREYEEYLKCPQNSPPIVEDWRSKSGGNQRNQHNRSQDYRSYRGTNQCRNWTNDNRWNRQQQGRDWSYSYSPYRQQGHYDSNQQGHQGYNSYNRRPHNDHY